MSNKHAQESHGSYTEGIRVKISERYKPPPKINLVMSYTQRVNLNKQIQDALPKYEFALEKVLKERMKEWRRTRSLLTEQRQNRLEKTRENMKKEKEKIEAERILKEKEEKEIDSVDENSISTNYENTIATCEYSNMNNSNSLYNNTSLSNATYGNSTYSSSSNMLIPTQASIPSYSNILTPIPLTNKNYDNKPPDKSPFNISDFEADTASPFDHMELKSINDMEELARVLKTDDAYIPATTSSFYTNYNDPPQSGTHNQANFSNYQMIEHNYNYNIPNDITYSQPQPVMSTYGNTNGYYYQTEQPMTAGQSFSTSYPFSSNSTSNTVTSNTNSFAGNKKAFNSVPDVMKSLETELQNTSLENSSYGRPQRITSCDSNRSNLIAKNAIRSEMIVEKEELDDPYLLLPNSLQELSKSISSMGFPLPMVARTCKNLGNDHKKIVEHLLAMTELLDLGFPEKDVSGALLACDNDRDKALDKLIS